MVLMQPVLQEILPVEGYFGEHGNMHIDEAINHIKENEKKRKFTQSIDLIISLKNIDLKKPENNISKIVQLPHESRRAKLCIISDSLKPMEGIDIVNKKMIEDIAKDKKKAKQFVNDYQFFLCEAQLMPFVGKMLGRYLGPRNKMPNLIPPNASPAMLKSLINEAGKSIRIAVKGTATIQCCVGRENMDKKKVAENINKVLDEIVKALPKGKNQIKNAYIKLTMGKPVKIEF